ATSSRPTWRRSCSAPASPRRSTRRSRGRYAGRPLPRPPRHLEPGQDPPTMDRSSLTPTLVRPPAAPSAAPLNLAEYEALARTRLPAAVYDYYAGGADDEITLRANRWVYERLGLRPRVLVDVSRIDMSVELLGTRLAL